MNGVLVFLGSWTADGLPSGSDLIGTALQLGDEGAGPTTVALLDANPEAGCPHISRQGAANLLCLSAPPGLEKSEVAAAALRSLIESLDPAVVLIPDADDALAYAPGVAARGGHGFADDVVDVSWGDGPIASCLVGRAGLTEFDFRGKATAILLVRGRRDVNRRGQGVPKVSRRFGFDVFPVIDSIEDIDTDRGGALTDSDFLLSIGRGVGDAAQAERLRELASTVGASLSGSGPAADAGWIPRNRQVGISGNSVAPRVYLAFGISGSELHLAGILGARTVIAVNSDPSAPIFEFADYGAVADLNDVVLALERRFAAS